MKTKKLITWSSYTFYLLVTIYLTKFIYKGVVPISFLHEFIIASTWFFAFEFIRKRSIGDYVGEPRNWRISLWMTLGIFLLHVPIHVFYMGSLGSDEYNFEMWHLFFGPYIMKSLWLLLQTIAIVAFFRLIWLLNESFYKHWKKITIIGSFIIIIPLGGVIGWRNFNNANVSDNYLQFTQNPKSFKNLISHPDLKGKFVYVDFWHSGCGPCLIEMKKSKDFKASLKAEHQDNIIYLYVGVDRSVPDEKSLQNYWINKLGVTGKHHFISRKQYRTWWDQIKAPENQYPFFPFHLWIDPNGEILVKDAPGIGHEFRKLIEDSFLKAE